MDEPTRRAWSKPELIVLVRGRSEEAVLGACKIGSGSVSEGPTPANDACIAFITDHCAACSGTAPS